MDIKGLTSQEAAQRAAEGKINTTGQIKTKSVKKIVLEHTMTLFNILNVILAIAVISVGSFKNVLFMVIVTANTLIGIVQEVRSKKMVDQLSIMVASKAKVLRDGMLRPLSYEEIVLDDVLYLTRGDQIPADCVILAGSGDMNESLVTGESDTVHKGVGSELLSGSYVSGGRFYAKVIRVGSDSFASRISKGAKVVRNSESEIMMTLKRIITVISCIILPLGALLFYNQMTLPDATIQSAVVGTVAALVSMIPEGLMLLTSTVLAVAVIRLAFNHVLVQQIYCIETLARVDVLCLDKTGTITTGRMKVDRFVYFENSSAAEVVDAFRALMAATQDESPTVDAIKESVGCQSDRKAVRTVSFSSEKKWSGARFDDGTTYIMGAGEMIIGSAYESLSHRIQPEKDRHRVLLLCKSRQDFKPHGNLPDGLEPAGAVLIEDEIRPEAAKTVSYFTDQKVELKVISGDGVGTVSAIASAVGIPGSENTVDATTLHTDADYDRAVRECTVFGRVTPMQKKQLVKVLQDQGHKVAMTGDGVNDVLAMTQCDCSVAMADGSDAARNIAQLVLTTNDFSAMPKVVAEGRRSINNIQRSASLFLNKTIFAIITSTLLLFIDLPYPFQPIQMSFISAITIGIPSFILAMEPNKERISGSFFHKIISRAVPGGVSMALGVFLVMMVGSYFNLPQEIVSTMAVIVTGATEIYLLFKISYPFDTIRAVLFGAVLVLFVSGALLCHELLDLYPLGLQEILFTVAIMAICLASFLLLFRLMDYMTAQRGKRKNHYIFLERRRDETRRSEKES